MQCLARAVARAAAEGYAGRRFVASGHGAARSYGKRRSLVAVQHDAALQYQKHKFMAKARMLEAKMDKIIASQETENKIRGWFYFFLGCCVFGDILYEAINQKIGATIKK